MCWSAPGALGKPQRLDPLVQDWGRYQELSDSIEPGCPHELNWFPLEHIYFLWARNPCAHHHAWGESALYRMTVKSWQGLWRHNEYSIFNMSTQPEFIFQKVKRPRVFELLPLCSPSLLKRMIERPVLWQWQEGAVYKPNTPSQLLIKAEFYWVVLK